MQQLKAIHFLHLRVVEQLLWLAHLQALAGLIPGVHLPWVDRTNEARGTHYSSRSRIVWSSLGHFNRKKWHNDQVEAQGDHGALRAVACTPAGIIIWLESNTLSAPARNGLIHGSSSSDIHVMNEDNPSQTVFVFKLSYADEASCSSER